MCCYETQVKLVKPKYADYHFFNVLSCLFSKLFKLTPQIMRERSAEKLFEKTGNKIKKKKHP